MRTKATAYLRAHWGFVLVLLLITILRMALAAPMMINFSAGTIYDDIMQIEKAFQIAQGNWLGEYGSMTLVKGVGYPLLTAVFHQLGLPYVFAYHGLYMLACIVFMLAIRPIVRSRWAWLAGYALLLFNPIAFATQLTRLYRDIGYYSLSFLCIALVLGLLLRYQKGGYGFALVAGLVLAFAEIYREDSHWLYVYVVACLAAWLILRLVFLRGRRRAETTLAKTAAGAGGPAKQPRRPFFRRAGFLLGVPALVLAGWLVVILSVSSMNMAYYGTFTTDEYNSGAYARAYGALKRIDGGHEDPHLVIPEEMRVQLYRLSPAFAELYEALDAPQARFSLWKEVQGEYLTGYFSFVLRDAVAFIGYYRDAQTANAYYLRLADEVNALCDAGQIEAGPPAYGITAKFYGWMTLPILQATFDGMLQTLRCTGINPLPNPANEDDVYLRRYENFVHGTIAAYRYMEDGTTTENFQMSGPTLWLQRLARACVMAYRALLLPLFCIALALFAATIATVLWRRRSGLAFWARALAVFSILCAFLLRSAMIGFVHVSSFPAISTPAYQAANYPLVIAFIVAAFLLFVYYVVPLLPHRKAKADSLGN